VGIKNKIVLVTGGVRGLGEAISTLFLENGATVIACDINEEKAKSWLSSCKENGYKNSDYVIANVSDFNSCKNAITTVIAKYGQIDVLINNAGITRDKTLLKMEEEQWSQVIDTNLNSMFNVTKQVLPSMVEKNFGRIVNISSVVGIIGNFGQTNYAAAKAGILGFSKSLALEVARKGITVNAICPGFIKTEMTDLMPEKTVDMIKGLIPMHRMGKPCDIARAALFLADEDADYISGTELHINGGFYR
jgi:acetoacetyl-CoA reductase